MDSRFKRNSRKALLCIALMGGHHFGYPNLSDHVVHRTYEIKII